ncbi:MAG: hypothetical protein ACYTGX_10830, partial [Planctomycetota bacterium]
MEEPSELGAPEPPAPEPWVPPAASAQGPALRRPAQIWISWACVAALVGFSVMVALLVHIPPPEINFQEPGKYLLHTAIGESLGSGGDTLTPTAKALADWTEPGEGVPPEFARRPEYLARTFTEGIDHSTDVHALRLLAVVQLEREETKEAADVLDRLRALDDGRMADRIGAAYGVAAFTRQEGETLPPIESRWAESTVAERAAAKRGDAPAAARHRSARLEAGALGAWTMLIIDGGVTCMALLGIVFLPAYLLKRPDLTVASGLTRPPWSPAEGFGVIARGGLVGLLMGQCCCGMWAVAASPAMWVATLMMGVPSLILGVLYLHRPYGVHFLHAFGLVEVRWGKMLAVTFACLCLTFTAQ